MELNQLSSQIIKAAINVHKELDAAWDLGYTPFVNLTAYQRTMEEVANSSDFEKRLRAWASAFASWSRGGKKRAFIAPLQEMNGGWVRYGLDPENFQIAWLKILRSRDVGDRP